MARPLLPAFKVGRDEPATWSAATAKNGIFTVSRAEMMGNLIWPDGVVPAAVSHPLAAAEAFRWLLELNEDRAVRLLLLLLQGQFLGAVIHEELEFSESAVGAIIQTATREGRIIVWRPLSEKLGLGRAPIAGSLGLRSDYPLFPAARLLASRETCVKLSEALAASHGLDLDAAGKVRLENAAEHRFRSVVARLRLMLPDGSPWRTALSTIAAGAAAAPSFPSTAGLIPPDVTRDRWECGVHAQENRSWVEDCKGQTIVLSASATELRCPQHPLVQIRDTNGDAVTVDRLGAGVLSSHSQTQLVVWSDVERHPHGLNIIKSQSELAFNYWGNDGPRIVLKGRVLTLNEILAESWPLNADRPQAPGSTVGLRAEFLPLLTSLAWEPVASQWVGRLKGRSAPVAFARPTTQQSPDPRDGLVVWPRERPDSEWAAEIVAVAFSYGPEEAALVIRHTESGQLSVGPYLKLPWGLPSEGQAEYVALRKEGCDLGVVPLERTAKDVEAGSVGHLAIDFGTSNTVVAFQAAHDADLSFIEQGVLDGSSANFHVGAGSLFSETLDQYLIIFGSWYRERERIPMFGSLYFERDGGKRGFSILPRKTALFRRIAEGPDKLYADLKWGDPNGPVRQRLPLYLERALLPAVEQLRLKGCRTITVAATYPLAFDGMRHGRLHQSLAEAVDRLARRAGISIESPRLISESIAGIAQVPGGIASYTLTIDLGGGTTDLAVVSAMGEPLAVDSLRIGGRALLGAVLNRTSGAERKRLNESLPPEATGIKAPVWFEAVLQEGPSALRAELAVAVSQAAVRQSLAAMFAGIVVAAVRLLWASVPERGAIVNLVLLGQGWELLGRKVVGAFDELWFVNALTERARGAFDIKLASQTTGRDRKLALVRGAMRLLVADRPTALDHVDPPKYLYMGLHRADGSVYSESDTIRAVTSPDFALGDPGFSAVLDDLKAVMRSMSGQGRELGDVDAVFAATNSLGQSLTVELVNQAVGMLTVDLTSADGLRASPLMRFIDGPWRQHWSGEKHNVEV